MLALGFFGWLFYLALAIVLVIAVFAFLSFFGGGGPWRRPGPLIQGSRTVVLHRLEPREYPGAVAEFSWFGDAVPRDERSLREHWQQVAKDIRHEREVNRPARTHESKRPRWRYWTRSVG